MVTVDLNHPLAGRRLKCELTIHEVRKLTDQERSILAGHNPDYIGYDVESEGVVVG